MSQPALKCTVYLTFYFTSICLLSVTSGLPSLSCWSSAAKVSPVLYTVLPSSFPTTKYIKDELSLRNTEETPY